ncbi:unnamed protein product [Rotaria magnacalcarata]|uniref:Uncharacterized protein n=2 Tax=Rotaria magnacalcarata TaxID=392030 RepID=A0A816U6Y2_9BILA|nr:unnamed protein product [Rotaria magnacalcarata]
MTLHERLKDVVASSEKYHIICDIINRQFNTNFSSAFIQQQIEFFSSSELFRSYLMFSVDIEQLITDYQKLTNYSIMFTKIEPMSRKCIICSDNDDVLPIYQLSKTFIFYENMLEQCVTLYSYCKRCKWSFYPNSYSHDVTRKHCVQRQQVMNTNTFHFGGECVYSHRIFLSFSSALLAMRASYHGFVKHYNSIVLNKTAFREKRLDEKNFQINWIVYTVLKLLFLWSDKDIVVIPYSLYDKEEVNAFFDRHKDELYRAFVKHWSDHAAHKSPNCTTGCTDIMIVDGHQKTARITCIFNNCYDNTIEELGPVLVGCPKSVSKHSKTDSNGLCEKHIKVVDSIGNSAMRFDPLYDVTDEDCNVKRNELLDNKNRSATYGFLISFYSCGIVAGFDESIRSESPRRVLRHFIRIGKISKHPSGIMYDNACSIKLYMMARYGTDYFKSTPISDHLYHNVHFVIECFHEQNQTRHMCKNEMRASHPSHMSMFDQINSQIAEQTFSIIAQYKMHWSNYSYPKSYINFILFFHLYNCDASKTLF